MKDPILYWNQVALDLVASNHPDLFNLTKAADAPKSTAPDQPGPTRTSRAYAIAHLAMNDSWLGASGHNGVQYLPGKGVTLPAPPSPGNDLTGSFAVAGAAAHTLQVLYPQQAAKVVRALEDFHDAQGNVTSSAEAAAGIAYGEAVGRAILKLRKDDNSHLDGIYVPRNGPAQHRVDPLNPTQGFLDPRWGEVQPFLIPGLTGNFIAPPPPLLSNPEFLRDYNEVKDKGAQSSTSRTTSQKRIGLYWAYDGALKIGVPPRLYNQVVRAIVDDHSVTDTTQLAQLFAAVNAAMADAGISAWYTKYRYNVARPVVAIREADSGWGPTGQGNGAGYTGDPSWLPLGAPRTNEPAKTSLTPNFPAYPSGHATFGTACLQVIRRFFGVPAEPNYNDVTPVHPDAIWFDFISDELDGKSIDNDGSLRTRYTHRFSASEEAVTENAESRVWLGVHWRFDAKGGVLSGRAIGDHAASAFFGSGGVAAPKPPETSALFAADHSKKRKLLRK